MIKRYKIEFEHWRKWFAVLSAFIMFLAFQMKYDEIDFCVSMNRDFVANTFDTYHPYRNSSIILFPLHKKIAQYPGGGYLHRGWNENGPWFCLRFVFRCLCFWVTPLNRQIRGALCVIRETDSY